MSTGYGHQPAPPSRLWLHALLLLLTLLTTTIVGARLAANFEQNLPAFQFDEDLAFLVTLWEQPLRLTSGLPFSLTLLAILFAHEFGHYLVCRYHRIESSLPYFLPAPTLIGTFGAFIRIRDIIQSSFCSTRPRRFASDSDMIPQRVPK